MKERASAFDTGAYRTDDMHAFLQTGSQLHAHRLQLYASSPHLQVLPRARGYCSSAEELGSRESDHRGPCLVLLSDCRISPEEFNRHICSTFLRGYIVRVYWFEYSTSSRTEFVSHLNTLIQQHKEHLDSLAISRAISESGSSSERGIVATDESNQKSESQSCQKLKIRLQTYPRSLAESLVDELIDIDCQLHGFSHALYALDVDGIYRYGISTASHMYLPRCDREDLAKNSVARASLKLEEVMQALDFHLQGDMIAMDLGASPGAWTQFLSKHIYRVVAVDPAQLHEEAMRPNVTHIRKMAQDAVQELAAWSDGNGFDLLVCDVNRYPVEAANLVLPFISHLKTGGFLVLTLKFHGRGRDKDKKVDEIKAIFREVLTNMECIWLLANSIYERTFVGKKM